MPIGQSLNANYQYEIGQLDSSGNVLSSQRFSTGDGLQVESVSGLFDMPPMSDYDVDNPLDPGAFSGPDIPKKRQITMVINLLGDPDLGLVFAQNDTETKLNLMQRWFQPSSQDLYLAYRRPGMPDRFVYFRPKRRQIPSDAELAHGFGKCTVQLDCADPLQYSVSQTVVYMTIPNGGSSTSTVIMPSGETSTPPVITVNGPASTPQVTNSDYGNKTLKFAVGMSPGATCTADVRTKNLLLGGAQNFSILSVDSKWWRLIARANNHITYARTDTGAASTVSIAYHDAWL